MPEHTRPPSAQEIIERYVNGPARAARARRGAAPGPVPAAAEAPLQNATKDYNAGGVSDAAAGQPGAATADPSDACGAMLQNATNPAQTPPAVTPLALPPATANPPAPATLLAPSPVTPGPRQRGAA